MPLSFRKKRANALRGHWRGRGLSTYARIAKIMSGRAISQQRLAITPWRDKDLLREVNSEVVKGLWFGAWACMSD